MLWSWLASFSIVGDLGECLTDLFEVMFISRELICERNKGNSLWVKWATLSWETSLQFAFFSLISLKNWWVVITPGTNCIDVPSSTLVPKSWDYSIKLLLCPKVFPAALLRLSKIELTRLWNLVRVLIDRSKCSIVFYPQEKSRALKKGYANSGLLLSLPWRFYKFDWHEPLFLS